ncbi:lipopolysaccharide 1,2-glucosyltransferase [[Pantoea] beijingensis]|uniref:Lipopolysaccharide 1,2-glucosyltransferase n=1 Tax=[Pantoea] beijingensis TaxID=1324864 RepID=A0A443IGM4_9GAMM|nr:MULTISPECIES: glycosyltransferase [Erwiniaceae]RWR03192.1 lipopolysaccharide 1,2-glucosyltransferase [[Pantoea] beijingensis]
MNIDFSRHITKEYKFNYCVDVKESNLNVAYGVDKNFLFGAGISITSILINNIDMGFNFYIFTDYADPEYVDKIQSLAKQYSTNIEIYIFNNDEFKVLPSTKFWTYAMYYRYVAFEYLSSSLESVLYLDADVICKGSLIELTKINLGEKYAAVVNDLDIIRMKSAERLNIPALAHDYFNSGVVFANLVIWKRMGLLSEAFKILLDEQSHLLYFDQDVLNILFVNHLIILRRDFNCINGVDQVLDKTSKKHVGSITDNTILVHYVGVTKPWHSWADYPISKYFLDAYQKSVWNEQPLLKANTAKLFKRKSRHERLQKKYVKSIFSHIMYIKSKIIKSSL